jgi:hypothetical protein
MHNHRINRKITQLLSTWILLIFLSGCATVGSNHPSASVKVLLQNHSNPLSSSVKTQITPSPSQHKDQPSTSTPQATPPAKKTSITVASSSGNIKTVFVIVMENHNWSDIQNNPSAPYINGTLLPQASYALQYFNPPGNHPSEPNYLWLEAGTNFNISNDNPPKDNHQASTDHLVTYLDKAGITWKAYEENITGKVCPLNATSLYAPKHNPMVFFDNVTGSNDPNSSYCISHERPYSELKTDLLNNTVSQYNFITPNLCNDMHNSNGCQSSDEVKNGDTWLSQQIPMIMNSKAYQEGGAIFITWDESENGDHPIGMIVLSPFVKGGGYSNSIHYTHSSTLRTIEEIFNITPLLGDASKATDLSDLFKSFP